MENNNRLPSKEDNPKGLHAKYRIQKIVYNGTEGFFKTPKYKFEDVDPDSEYFILRLDNNGKDKKHIEACRKAVLVYANEIKDHLPELSKDLIQRYSHNPLQ